MKKIPVKSDSNNRILTLLAGINEREIEREGATGAEGHRMYPQLKAVDDGPH